MHIKRVFSYRFRRLRRAALCGVVRHYPALKGLLSAATPLVVQKFSCGDQQASELMVFLPGISDVVEDFERNRFMEAVCASRKPADMLVADLHAGYYFQVSVLDRLHKDVIEPARACGYEAVWLVGISLGGFGALLYAMQNTSDIDGLMLLAPYLGEDDLIAEIAAAGGLSAWDPGAITTTDYPRRIWWWLKRAYALPQEQSAPQMYLGYGNRDWIVRANTLLANNLPRNRVFTVAGGHDWKAWRTLWRAMLAHREAEMHLPSNP